MKYSFQFAFHAWEATSGECGRQIHSEIEFFYILHLTLAIERLIK